MGGKGKDDLDGLRYSPPSAWNTESYDPLNLNPFLGVEWNLLSTFSIDVDTASYANIRRFLSQGQLPPKDAVRIEEMVNYFTYNYPVPTDKPFSVSTEVGHCPWNAGHQLMHIGIQGKKVAKENLPPNNLVFLIDVSGSMDEPNKLPLLIKAFTMLTGELRPQDRVAIVVYAGRAGLVL
ncbi:MAG: von Willebrand factor type A domain-containing protein, partial [Spirochaetia bacterium]|nr:von Willebrand factor type A domain-containing protein [Spirochaetia bacterium]